jgi:predicted Rossmann-fold nucleotide-binding protein
LKGNKDADVTVDKVVADFYEDKKIELKHSIIVPDLTLRGTRQEMPRYDPRYQTYMFFPGRGGNKGNIIKIGDVNPKEERDLISLSEYIRKLGNVKNIFYFDTFPAIDILDVLACPENRRNVGAIVFATPPIMNATFSAEQYMRIKHLAERGVEVIWDHQKMGRLFFHRIAFMEDAERKFYDQAYSSSSIVAAFGSASRCTDEDRANAISAIEGFARFTGGIGYMLNGGGPYMMEAFTQAAKEHNLRVGTISLNIAQEQQQDTHRHLLMPFSDNDLSLRQSLMVEASTGYLVFEGGLGTLYEYFEVCVKNIIDRRARPIFVIGDSDFQKSAYGMLEKGVKTGKISASIFDVTYHLRHGNELFDKFMQHYNFQNSK